MRGELKDFRFSSGVEKSGMFTGYKIALAEACRQSGLSAPLLEAAIARDLGVGLKQEKLPPLPPRSEKD